MEKIVEFFKNAFGTAEDPKIGGLIFGAIIAAITGLIGFVMPVVEGPLGAALGAGLGLIGGAALLGNSYIAKSLGFESGFPAPKLTAAPQKDAVINRDTSVFVDGKLSPHHTPTPNLDRFKQVSSAVNGSVADLVEERHKIEALPEDDRGMEIKKQLEKEGAAAQLLANIQEWNEAANKWLERGGERDKLIGDLQRAKKTAGENFDPSSIRNPPKITIKMPTIPDDLKEYVQSKFIDSRAGSTVEDFNVRYPKIHEQLDYAWKTLDAEAKHKNNQPDWNVVGNKVFGIGWRDRTKLSPGVTTALMAAAAAISAIPTGGASLIALGGASLAGAGVGLSISGIDKVREFLGSIGTQGEAMHAYLAAIEKRQYALAVEVAKKGQQIAKNGRAVLGFIPEGYNDKDAEVQFRRAERQASALLKRERIDLLRAETYLQVANAEQIIKQEFPVFIEQVETLQNELKRLNEKNKAIVSSKPVPTPQKPAPTKSAAPAKNDGAALDNLNDIMKVASDKDLGNFQPSANLPPVNTLSDNKSKPAAKTSSNNLVG